MEAKIIVLVLLGPLSALYDFCTSPTAPPQIFVAQYTEAFGHPPQLIRPINKRVFITRPQG